MPKIQRLDNFTINQIAAGEVVERPSSVIKELVENAVDANSTAITIEIENGGSTLIRITDNGEGMEMEDAVLSFERHATSKIHGVNDLNGIVSLGFRGEALASISAVSQMEMITRQRGGLSGTHIVNHGGKIISAKETGCPEGTTFIVRNLFYNTPARLKFLKSNRSETAMISELVAKLILSHPDIAFKYVNQGKLVYHSPGNKALLPAILSIYGREVSIELILVEREHTNPDVKVYGYIGKPSLSRSNRNHQSFFVNGRYIKSTVLSHCLEESYHHQIMINHFPWAVLHITLPPQEVDVNVHPSKTEIRFRNEEQIMKSLLIFLEEAVHAKPYIPSFHTSEQSDNDPNRLERLVRLERIDYKERMEPIDPKERMEPIERLESVEHNKSDLYNHFEKNRDENKNKRDENNSIDIEQYTHRNNTSFMNKNEITSNEARLSEQIHLQSYMTAVEKNITNESIKDTEDDHTIDTFNFMEMKIIGSVFSTYILVESKGQLIYIDQHAAHERLIYEDLKEMIKHQKVVSQQLLPPCILEVTHDEYITIMDSMEMIQSVGFDIETFGGLSFIIRGLPVLLKSISIRELFQDLLDMAAAKPSQANKMALLEEDIIKMSCKKAIKAHDKLSEKEIFSLLKVFHDKKTPMTCPHGRPIMLTMSQAELEKRFKRIQ